jgi:aryl carrier-like protein
MPDRPAGTSPTLDDLRKDIAAMLGLDPDEIPLDANLVHLGVDSLGLMRLANRWRRAGIRVPFRELAAEPTLAAWRRFLTTPPE